MIVSIHQPAYLPWLGYLSRIYDSDVFVFLDIVQFEKNSFTNRNKIKTPNGPIWLTVPVMQQGHIGKKLSDIRIDSQKDWKKKHLRSIEMNYRKAPYFDRNIGKLKEIYDIDDSLLCEFCYRQLIFWLGETKINTKILRASELPIHGYKSDLILSICQYLGATRYISGPLGRGYLNESDFESSGIMVEYQDFSHPIYPQLYGEFSPGMGVVDYWMNCGVSFPFYNGKKQ